MTHIMLDLETWGTRPGCALRSIGAVVFGLRAGIGQEFYRNVERTSCEAAGLTVDPQTEAWWSRQSAAAQAALNVDPVPLAEAIREFSNWFRSAGGTYVWSQDANFDEPIITAAFRACAREPAWRFYNARDTRTVYAICGFDDKSLPRAGTYHNALDDAKHQARCIQAALASAAARSPKIAEQVGAAP